MGGAGAIRSEKGEGKEKPSRVARESEAVTERGLTHGFLRAASRLPPPTPLQSLHDELASQRRRGRGRIAHEGSGSGNGRRSWKTSTRGSSQRGGSTGIMGSAISRKSLFLSLLSVSLPLYMWVPRPEAVTIIYTRFGRLGAKEQQKIIQNFHSQKKGHVYFDLSIKYICFPIFLRQTPIHPFDFVF